MRAELSRDDGDKDAFVIPAFQLNWICDVDEKDSDCYESLREMMPRTQQELRSLIDKEKVAVFDFHIEEAHGTTNIKQWYSLEKYHVKPIDCIQSNRYEPYLILRNCNDIPPYQARFTGYGKNKIQQVLHLRRLGYRFAVIGEAWVVHWPHNKSESKISWNMKRNKKKHTNGEDSVFQREKMDMLFVKFEHWLKTEVETTGETAICDNVR